MLEAIKRIKDNCLAQLFRTIASSFQTSQNGSPQLFLKYTKANDKNQILTFTAHFPQNHVLARKFFCCAT